MERNIHGRHGSTWSLSVLGHVDGTREEALAALRARAEAFDPALFTKVTRRRLYAEGDGNGFMLLVEGRFARAWHFRFKIAELLHDSAPPPPPPPQPEPVRQRKPRSPRSPRPPRPRAAPQEVDIPERPAWLGRDDLA
ncbi:hypothetical protein [Streptomyces sp. NPDC058157]|uniref:hypothetical protein n=1 Tax=Streptomyces sp. NPDC058157 TaxID=3346360 RepID=UPI0036EFC1BB